MWPFAPSLPPEPATAPRVTITIKLEGTVALGMALRKVEWALLDLRRQLAEE